MYQSLPKSYRGKFPFKLATTSFIYPDHYAPNVRMLGSFVDEIELLLLESNPPEALPSHTDITELYRSAQEFDVSYNVHLPMDISISDPDATRQQQATEALIRIIELVSPLSPTSYCLHIPYDEGSFAQEKVKNWQERVLMNLERVLGSGIKAQLIAIETLDYPYEILDDIISALNLSVCMDAGHLIIYGLDIKTFFEKYNREISIIHLHGAESGRDHLALGRLSGENMTAVISILRRFTGVVSLELFSYDDLKNSLQFLDDWWT